MKDFRDIQNHYDYTRIHTEALSGKYAVVTSVNKSLYRLGAMTDDEIIIINKFDATNNKHQTPDPSYNELMVNIGIWSEKMEKTLLYALTSGTAYKIVNGDIYIWYSPRKGMKGSGFFKLTRFVFIDDIRVVRYFLNKNEPLLDSQNPL